MADFRKDDEGRRYGDWMHKDLRGDPNYYEVDPDEAPWYKRTAWIVAFLVFLWPVGLVLCWRGYWPIAGKVLATVLVVAVVAFIALMQVAYFQALASM